MSYTSVVLADSPGVFWMLDDPPASSSVADISGNSRPGTVNPTPTFGVAGPISGHTAMSLAVTGSGVFRDDNFFDFTGTSNYSLEIWANPTSLDTNLRRVLSAGAGAQGIYAIHAPQDDIAAKRQNSGGVDICSPGAPIPTGSWSYLVYTYDGTNIRLYRNGSILAGPTASSRVIPTAAGSLTVGNQWDGGDATTIFLGSLAAFAAYSTVLSAGQVSAHYAAGITPSTDILLPHSVSAALRS